jgi:arylsulfatase A-like enzyme
VHAPSIVKGGETSSHFQNLVDIPTTFASLAGLSVPLEWEGIDQSQTWKNPEKMSRPFNIIEERPFSTDFNQRIVHEDNWKLCYYAGRDYGELYNLKADPHQIHNLYDCPEHQSVKQKLVGRILDHEMNKRRPTQNHGKTFLHR